MVSVPFRGAPVFAAALNRTVPLPLSLGAVVMVSHDVALLTAVQAQPIGPVTFTAWLFAAPAPIENVSGLTPRLHSTPPWLTVTVWPATVSVALRLTVPLLAVKLKPTDPLPEPDAPEVIVIHDASGLLVAVQLHDDPLVTVTVWLPALADTSNDVGLAVYEHAAAAAWLIVVVAEPTVMVLLRAEPVLAATLYLIVPFPGPAPPDAIVIHDAPLTAFQLQNDGADTPIGALLLPPVGTSTFVGFRLYEQAALS